MDIAKFTDGLIRARPRVEALKRAGDAAPAQAAVEELHVAWEELAAAEEELHQQQAELESAHHRVAFENRRYRDLFDAAPDPYMVTDAAGNVREANRAAMEALRATERTLIGKPLVVFIAPAERRAFRTLLARLPQLRRLADWQTLIQPRQAAAWPASISVMAAAGHPAGATGELRWLIRDVSETQRHHEDLRAMNETLEGRIRQRTVELEQQAAELEAALRRESGLRARAEEADRAKDAFLGTVSHELRTPLSALLGWVHLLAHGATDPSLLQRAHAAIERSARAQIKLVDDILDASRMMTGKLQLERGAMDLAEMVSAAVATLKPSASARSLRLENGGGGALPVYADPDRMQQVIWNLVSNAVKFTPRGGTIEVRSERVGDQAVVAVADSGVGIDPAFLPKVFERFSQADSSTTRSHGGLGLGLAISRYIVEAHGGTLTATSDGPGRGATFRVAIPLDLDAAPVTSLEVPPPPPQRRGRRRPPRARGRG
jgi:PAS domain S-box-containing protein